MASLLPQLFVLKPYKKNTCLRYINQSMEGVQDILQFSGKDVVSIHSRFEKETAGPDNPDLVHIKSSYNNNYWRRANQEDSLIVAGPGGRQQQQNLWSCTLFKPELVLQEPDNDKGIVGQFRFIHVQLEKNIGPSSAAAFREVLSADDQNTVFTVINCENLVTLPRHLAFRGNNGKHLSAQTVDHGHTYLQFSVADPNDPTVENEIFNFGDGSVRIRSTSTGNLWRRHNNPHNNTDNCICADTITDDNYSDDDTLFWPVQIENPNINGNLVVALRNLGNQNFCRRLTTDNNVRNYLNAGSENITTEAYLEVIRMPDPIQT